MSNYIPNDLAIVSEYAREQMVETVVKAETVDVQMTEASNVVDIDIDSLDKEEEVKLETVEVQQDTAEESAAEIKQEDALDAAIAGKAVDYDSSDVSLSSSDDDSSSESEEEEQVNNNKGRVAVSDDEDDGPADGIVKTAHEIVEFEVEKPTFTMTPTTSIVLAGEVFQVVDNVVVVQSRPGSEFTTLDQGSLLVYEDRDIMGEVFETFGPIARPFYTVRFKSRDEIKCKVADPVFYVPDYQNTQFVQTEALKKIKGSDASNMYDEEADEEEEFSDDEKEKEHKLKLKREKKARKGNGPSVRAAYASRDNVHDNQTYNNLVKTIPPRQQQSYADMFDDFSSSLDAYQHQRQQQSYADISDDFGASLDSYQQRQQPPQQQPNRAAELAAALLNPTPAAQTTTTSKPTTAPSKSSIFGTLPSLDEIEKRNLE